MSSTLCPYCGKAGHDDSFECPGRPAPSTLATGAPAFTPPVDPHASIPSQPAGGFAALEAALGTKLGAGTKVGEYQIQDRVGEGGMGTVYSAIHPIIGKKVAIKVLAARLAKNKNAIRRFVLEARAVNDIQHPGLVDIFSFGQLTDGRHYYVMEFLEGRNLGDVLRERVRLPAAEAIPIFIEVAHALVAVHAKGIVHRDLKPENILLLAQPQAGGQRVKLVDFGLAKLVEGVPAHLSESGPRTAAGVNVGTPHYMSPEQCRGSKVDARSDLYALGVLLYETVTGRVPFDGATPLDIWQAHAEKAPEPPIAIAPANVNQTINAIILRLMAKSPEHRIQSASDLCVVLQSLNEAGHWRRGTPVAQAVDLGVDAHDRASGRAHARPGMFPFDAATRGPTMPIAPEQAERLAQYDDLASTTEDLPIVHMPEVAFSDEDRRKEIEDLRTTLGLRIEEPASDSQEEEQMSALVIDLGTRPPPGQGKIAKPGAASESHRLAGAPNLRRPSKPIEERSYVPPLAAPAARGRSVSHANLARTSRSRTGLVLGIVLVAAFLIAGAALVVHWVR
jgi:tRNA A-37 threonylcarbamoyl transferase component Bud32